MRDSAGLTGVDGGFGIYVHWPFCAAKCPYCDFNSHVRGSVDQDRWAQALVRDLRTQAEGLSEPLVDSIFFGGGTPSLMPPTTVGALLDAVADRFALSATLEVTLEANPTSADRANFDGYAAAGVNRLSLGVQALRDADLKALGRLHTVAEAKAAAEMAARVFPRTSIDLIYARQNQSPSAWEAELREALDLGFRHLSLYQLTIEPGTAFGDRHAQGRLAGLPEDGPAAEMYATTQALCAEAGLPAYEISNHAARGEESRHNLVYWRGGRYLGLGPGAHGRVVRGGRRIATAAERSPERWLRSVEDTGQALVSAEPLAAVDQVLEYVMMALRLEEGLDRSRVAAMGGMLDDAALDALARQGALEVDSRRVRATDTGRLVLNEVLRQLLVA